MDGETAWCNYKMRNAGSLEVPNLEAPMVRRIVLSLLLPLLAAVVPSAEASGRHRPFFPESYYDGVAFWGHRLPFVPIRCVQAPESPPWHAFYPQGAYNTRPVPMAYPFWPSPMTGQGQGPAQPHYQAYPGSVVPSYANYPSYWGR